MSVLRPSFLQPSLCFRSLVFPSSQPRGRYLISPLRNLTNGGPKKNGRKTRTRSRSKSKGKEEAAPKKKGLYSSEEDRLILEWLDSNRG